MVNIICEIVGWAGTAAYIAGYLFLALGRLKADRTLYHFLNIAGAIGLTVNALHYGNYPSVFVNLAWFAIGLVAVIVILRKQRVHSDEAIE